MTSPASPRGVSRAASSESSAAAAFAPRAAARSAASSRPRRNGGVRGVGREGEMVGSLLDVIDRLGKGAVDCTGAWRQPPARNRSRREGDVRTADGNRRARPTPSPTAASRASSTAPSLPYAVVTSSTVGLVKSGTEHEDVERLGRQPSETAAEELVQARRDGQRQAGLRPRARANQLTAELERQGTGCLPRPPAPEQARAWSAPAQTCP